MEFVESAAGAWSRLPGPSWHLWPARVVAQPPQAPGAHYSCTGGMLRVLLIHVAVRVFTLSFFSSFNSSLSLQPVTHLQLLVL